MAEIADALRRLHEEATPGPWQHLEKGRVFNAVGLVTEGCVHYPGGNDPDDDTPYEDVLAAERLTERTGEMIATLRNALPEIAALVEANEVLEKDWTHPLAQRAACRALAALRAKVAP